MITRSRLGFLILLLINDLKYFKIVVNLSNMHILTPSRIFKGEKGIVRRHCCVAFHHKISLVKKILFLFRDPPNRSSRKNWRKFTTCANKRERIQNGAPSINQPNRSGPTTPSPKRNSALLGSRSAISSQRAGKIACENRSRLSNKIQVGVTGAGCCKNRNYE